MALGAHILLLWSVPGATPDAETVLAAITTVEWERWEPPAPAAPVSAAAESAPASTAPVLEPTPPAKVRPTVPSRRTGKAGSGETRLAEAARIHNVGGSLSEPQGDADLAQAPAADAARAQTAAGSQAAEPVTGQAPADGQSGAAGGQLTAASGSSHAQGAQGQGPGALMRGPRLLAAHDPCAGFFPGTAEAKRGQVQLSIDVDAQGHPHPTQTLLELPRGQGFENAAKACAAHLHFAPALDAQGRPVSARARIALRFERS